MTTVVKTFKYDDIENKKRFRIEPSRRATKKTPDPEQRRIFADRQKRLPSLWREMGVISWKVLTLRESDPWEP
ncbi:MAG: hypothetical protein LBQ42_03910 [Synergistaceae bacterium]|jgi:hypothetical protein|nr:hypothetical protein [Synergistaceae bacterium]